MTGSNAPVYRKVTSNAECIWITLGAVLSASTQLRMKRPVGPGEIILLLWILKEIYVHSRTSLKKYVWSHPFGKFWTVSLVSMLIGWAYAIYIHRVDSAAGRDFLSYIFASGFSITLCSSEAVKDYKKLMYWAFVTTTLLYGFLLLYSTRSLFLGPFQLFYQDARFEGLTKNPNQVALICSALPIFVVINWTDLRLRAKIFNAILLLVAFAIGIACSSDAWKLSWLVMAFMLLLTPLFPAIQIWSGAKVREKVGVRAVALLLVIVFLVGFTYSHAPKEITSISDKIFHHGTNAGDRLNLWQNGLFALREDPIFGLGPGAHSGLSGPFQGEESHSSFVEWATIAGVFCCAYLAVLFFYPIKKGIENRNFAPVIGLSALGIILIFHFLLRQPVLWFYLIILTASASAPSIYSQANPLNDKQ